MISKIGYNYFSYHSVFQTEADPGDDKPKPLPGFKVGITCLTLAYISMTIALTLIFGRMKKNQYVEEINKNSRSKITGDRILLWHFIFL